MDEKTKKLKEIYCERVLYPSMKQTPIDKYLQEIREEEDMVSKDLHYNHTYPESHMRDRVSELHTQDVDWGEPKTLDSKKFNPAPTTRKMQRSGITHPYEEDMINHPNHYMQHPSGVECIEITRNMSFNLGNAVKYIWRCDLKHDNSLEDLEKARFYLEDEIKKRKDMQKDMEDRRTIGMDTNTLYST